ncbi:MAG TPA: protein kinase [Planctomycetota bacterium]
MQSSSTVRLAGRVFGKCVLKRRIGKGGMARVFLAEHTLLRRPVAIKILSGDLTRDPAEIRRFLSEAVSIARLNHPHIITVHDVGQEEDRPYIVMEYAGKGDLHALVVREGALSPARATRIARDLAGALEHAHRAGILHQDFKPGNLLVLDDGRVKIGDFGLAAAGAPAGAAAWGTPQVLAPELILGAAPDVRSDLYALGVTLYFLVAGRYPFDGRTAATVARLQAENKRVPLPELCPEIPQALAALIDRLMARDPRQRFATAADVARELDLLLTAPRSSAETPFGWEAIEGVEAMLRHGTYGEALRRARRLGAARYREGSIEEAAAAHAACAHALCLLDDPARAERYSRGAGKLSIRCGSTLTLGWSLAAGALAKLRNGEAPAAEATVEMARGVLRAHPRHAWTIQTGLIAAEIALARDEFERAVALAEPAFDYPELRPRAMLLQAVARHRGGRPDDALTLLQRAARELAEEYDADILWKVQAALAEVADADAAPMHRKEAMEAVYRVAGGLEERERARFLGSPGLAGLLDPKTWSERTSRSHPLRIPPREGVEKRPVLSVVDVVRRINSEPSASRLAGTILEETLSLCGARRGALVLLKKGVAVACVSRDLDDADPAPLRALALRVIRHAFRQGGTFSSADVRKDPRLAELRAGTSGLPRSLLSVPFQVRGGVQGALYLDDPRPHAFSDREIELAAVVAEHGAAAIRLANLKAAMERDPVTGALTHAAFEDRLTRELQRVGPCSVLLLDVESLREIRNKTGRVAAKTLLRTLARAIGSLLKGAVVGRHGDDDLEVLLPGTSGQEARPAAARLIERLRSHSFRLDKSRVRVSVSVGVAASPEDGHDARTLILRAEQALRR